MRHNSTRKHFNICILLKAFYFYQERTKNPAFWFSLNYLDRSLINIPNSAWSLLKCSAKHATNNMLLVSKMPKQRIHSVLWFRWSHLNSCQQNPAWPLERARWLAEFSIILPRKQTNAVCGMRKGVWGSEVWIMSILSIRKWVWQGKVEGQSTNFYFIQWPSKKVKTPGSPKECLLSLHLVLAAADLSLYYANLPTPQGISSSEKVHLP